MSNQYEYIGTVLLQGLPVSLLAVAAIIAGIFIRRNHKSIGKFVLIYFSLALVLDLIHMGYSFWFYNTVLSFDRMAYELTNLIYQIFSVVVSLGMNIYLLVYLGILAKRLAPAKN